MKKNICAINKEDYEKIDHFLNDQNLECRDGYFIACNCKEDDENVFAIIEYDFGNDFTVQLNFVREVDLSEGCRHTVYYYAYKDGELIMENEDDEGISPNIDAEFHCWDLYEDKNYLLTIRKASKNSKIINSVEFV